MKISEIKGSRYTAAYRIAQLVKFSPNDEVWPQSEFADLVGISPRTLRELASQFPKNHVSYKPSGACTNAVVWGGEDAIASLKEQLGAL